MNIDAGTFTGAFELMKMFYILSIIRLENDLIMHEDRTTLEIYDKIYADLPKCRDIRYTYLNVFTQMNHFPDLIKLNKILIIIILY